MKKRTITLLFLFIFSFGIGFFTHALFFPALLTNNLAIYAKRSIQKQQVLPLAESKNKALTVVQYEDGQFDPRVVEVGKSYYLSIVNMSDKELMNLTSENPLLTTPRGYGKSEELRVQLYDVGEYEVSSTLHPGNILRVLVK